MAAAAAVEVQLTRIFLLMMVNMSIGAVAAGGVVVAFSCQFGVAIKNVQVSIETKTCFITFSTSMVTNWSSNDDDDDDVGDDDDVSLWPIIENKWNNGLWEDNVSIISQRKYFDILNMR